MHIFLYGPSGSGKTTVGKLLAESLGLPCIDLDDKIEQTTGKTVHQYIFENGETAFREIETSELRKIVAGPERVITLGGGSLLNIENQRLAQSYGQIVFLDADLSILSDRLMQDANRRPLLEGDLEKSLATLLRDREAHYRSFPIRVDAAQPPEKVAQDIQMLLGRFHLQNMGTAYDVIVQEGGLDSLGEMLKSREFNEKIVVVSDENVAPLYAERVKASLRSAHFSVSEQIISSGELNKNIETVLALWHGFTKANLNRKSMVIALGGGVVSDLVGFCAATYMRGCSWTAIPTTLLAMVDAAIGGKTAFDLPEGKNLVGAFYPPKLVLVDPNVLLTMPAREMRAGLAEVVKHGIIADPDLFDLCSEGWDKGTSHKNTIVRRAIAVKVKFVEEDPYEQSSRAKLNFGHTVGHAVELVSRFSMLHGEAVAVGMVAEAKLAERLSLAGSGLAKIIEKALSGLGLPVEIPRDLPVNELVSAMKMDKKKTNRSVRFSLPARIGEVKVGIEIDDLRAVLEEK